MGDEADALSAQGDDGAEEHYREWKFEQRQKAKSFMDAVRREVARQLKAAQYVPRGKMVEVVCISCGSKFMAREADRKRGWAKSCSKSCAATHKDKITHGRNREHYGY